MPFYKFGNILFLQKMERGEWIDFIGKIFLDSGKCISKESCALIAELMKGHPYYTQQLSKQTWLCAILLKLPAKQYSRFWMIWWES